MHSFPAFLAVAAVVTLTPGPAWGALSAVGVSALVAASRLAYDVLRGVGAAYLLWLGARALLRRGAGPAAATGPASRQVRRGFRRGAVGGPATPKLAVFFVALLPQFLDPGTAVLPAGLATAGTVVGCDVVVHGTVAVLVDRFRTALQPRLLRALERFTGAVLLGFGVRLATEVRPV